MNDYWKGISTAVIGAGVVGVIGYLLIVKENQIRIETLIKSVDSLSLSADETQKSLSVTRLFVAQAHPNRTLSQAPSLMKLQALDAQEIEQLAKGLSELEMPVNNKFEFVPPQLKNLSAKYSFTSQDLTTFQAVAQPFQAGEL